MHLRTLPGSLGVRNIVEEIGPKEKILSHIFCPSHQTL